MLYLSVMKKNYVHLSPDDRDRIAVMYNKGIPISDIARELGRNKGTISREIDRNSSLEYDCYLGNRAQQRADLRAENSHNHPRLRDEYIRTYVLSHLAIGWSPEQISGRIKIDQPGWSISYEAIYQYVYDPETPNRKQLIGFLRRSHRIRKPKSIGRRVHPTKIPNRIPIDQRPASVMTRKKFGHWETDSLVSRKSSAALNSTTERKTKLLFLSKIPSKTAKVTSGIIIKRFEELPLNARQTLTMDNGTENTLHETITAKLGTKCYFAHPYHSWERGTNENTNGLIRWYLPKGTDFSKITNEQIMFIESALNNRPRKCLGFKTPIEAASSFVALAH